MFETINKCSAWQKITNNLGIKKDEDKRKLLVVLIILLIIFILCYCFHKQVKRALDSFCRGLNKVNDGIYSIHEWSSTSPMYTKTA